MSVSIAIGAYRPLPSEMLFKTFEFLDERSLARSEGVCKDWHAQITSQDYQMWRIFSRNTGAYAFPTREELSAELENIGADATCTALASVFGTQRAFNLIFEFADENYKEFAQAIHGKVVLQKTPIFYLTIPRKQGFLADLPWGRNKEEPFIEVRVYNQESLDITARKVEERDIEAVIYQNGDWHNDYPRIPTRKFPKILPLRLFYNRDGSLKNHGDVLQLDYKGKHVQLQCDFNEHMKYVDNREFQTYAEAITYRIAEAITHRIDHSMRNFSEITQSSIDDARDAAMAETRTWIPSEARS